MLTALCLLPALLMAEEIPVEKAKAVATKFFQTGVRTRAASPQLQLVYDGESPATRTSQAPAYYVFNRTDAQGFIIIAGDDMAMPVLGYSEEHHFQADHMPPNLLYWLEGTRDQIKEARENGFQSSVEVMNAWETAASSTGEVMLELPTAEWNQDAPYNLLCPVIDGERTITGCVATAFAIVMRYHQWPDAGEGSLPTYSYKINSKSYSVPGHTLGHAYDWANMPLTYDQSSSTEAQNAVATLMYDCGVMAESQYYTETAAVPSKALQSAIQYMKYDKGAEYLYRSWFSDSEWHAKLKQELNTNGPVLYGGRNSKNEGHQFVLDGYTSDDYFRVNWGWGGTCNGYYLLSALKPSSQGLGGNSNSDFSEGQDAIFGFKKAEANSSYVSILVLQAQEVNGTEYVGLSTTETDIETGQSFSVRMGLVCNMGLTNFNGEIGLSLFDINGNWKEDICKPITITELQPYYGSYSNVNCTISKEIEEGDYISIRYRESGQEEWKLVYAWDETTVGRLVVRAKDPEIADGTALTYDRKERIIRLTTYKGITYKLLDSNGSEVMNGITASQSLTIEIDTNKLAGGSYTLVMEKGAKRHEVTFKVKGKE